MKEIDYTKWKRKEHFEFFSKYDNPFFGIVSEVDCTRGYEISKRDEVSFFAYYLHRSILAVNRVEELRLRMHDGKLVSFENIHAASTIGREDGTFGFSFVEFSPDFNLFNEGLQKEIAIVRNSTGLGAGRNSERLDVIHYSSLPWIRFTGVTYPRNFNTNDTVPKITFGKSFEEGNRRKMAVSIEAHHGMADGIHIARFLDEFQKAMDE